MQSIEINREEEYEYQFYGFSQSSVVEGIKDILDEVFESILDSMEQKLVNKVNYDRNAVAIAKNNLLLRYKENIEKHTEDLKAIVNQYFSLPKDVLLPEDEMQRTQYTENDEIEIDKQLKEAEEKLRALTIFEEKLKAILCSITECNNTLTESLNNTLQYCENIDVEMKQFQESTLMQIPEMYSVIDKFVKTFDKMKLTDK